MKIRRRARAIALQTLYEIDLAGHDPSQVLDRHLIEANLPVEGADFVRHLVLGVLENLEMLDRTISRIAPEWPCEQIAAIDRNILRIAIYEIAREADTPLKVAINEAVELAKAFGSDSSRRFINGALGTLAAQRSLLEV